MDGTNIERNLYLTTQLIELGIPVVVAVNMIDLVRKNGDQIDLAKLGEALGCQVVEISALKGEGGMAAAEQAVERRCQGAQGELPHVFTGSVEHAIAHIEESICRAWWTAEYLRWYAIKLFERDEKVMAELKLDERAARRIWKPTSPTARTEMDDDAESIITNQRYAYINKVVERCVKKKAAKHSLTTSDKIDRIVTNRDSGPAHLRGDHVCGVLDRHGSLRHVPDRLDQRRSGRRVAAGRLPRALLEGLGCADWLTGLVVDGIIRRRWRGSGLCSPDAGSVLHAVHPGGCAATWPALRSSWTVSSASSACPARALSPC